MIAIYASGVARYLDGREVCDLSGEGRREYRRRTLLMWERQDKTCCLCGLPLAAQDATFEHQDGRGMGGSRRDDRVEKDGNPYNGAAHPWCNHEKGSRRITHRTLKRMMY